MSSHACREKPSPLRRWSDHKCLLLHQSINSAAVLLGSVSGTPLGFPVEGSPPDICASYVKRLRSPIVDHATARRRNYAFGQYTDDSQLARELIVSYAELGRFDASDYAVRIRSIFAEDRIVGRGLATGCRRSAAYCSGPVGRGWYARFWPAAANVIKVT